MDSVSAVLRLIIVTVMMVAVEAVFCGNDGDKRFNYAKVLCGTETQNVNFVPRNEQKFTPTNLRTAEREQSIAFAVNCGLANPYIHRCSTKDRNKATVTAEIQISDEDALRVESKQFELDDSAPDKPRTANCVLVCRARSCPKIDCIWKL